MSNTLNLSFTKDEIDLIDNLALEFNVSRSKIVRCLLHMAFDESITIQGVDGQDLTFKDLTQIIVRFLLWREENINSPIIQTFNNLKDLIIYKKAFPNAL